MKNTLAGIAVFLAALMNLPYITEHILNIPPKRAVVANTNHQIVGLELCDFSSRKPNEEPLIGLELREYEDEYIEYVPYQEFTPSNGEGLLICNTFVETPTCVKKPCVTRHRCRPFKYIRHRRPLRRLLGCFGVRYYRCRRF